MIKYISLCFESFLEVLCAKKNPTKKWGFFFI